jgi:uncharacterized protein HemY
MILAWIAAAVLLASLIGIAIVIGRKLPLAAAVDPSHAPAAIRKAEIVETRLRRKFQNMWSAVSERGRPMTGKLGTIMAEAQSKLRDLEHEYRVRSLPVLLNRRQRHRLNEEIQGLLDQAEVTINEGEEKAAEEKCLQAIRMEPRSIPAFTMLGNLYIQRKEFAHAKEVFRYLEKLTEEGDAVYDHHSEEANQTAKAQATGLQVRIYQQLTDCYRGLEDQTAAFANIQEAYRLAPTNPKVLDMYIAAAIAVGKKAFAAGAVEKLRTVNPENSKIAEWEAAIGSMADTHLASPLEDSRPL